MNTAEKRKNLIEEFNRLESRQLEIKGALALLEEMDKEEKVEPKKK